MKFTFEASEEQSRSIARSVSTIRAASMVAAFSIKRVWRYDHYWLAWELSHRADSGRRTGPRFPDPTIDGREPDADALKDLRAKFSYQLPRPVVAPALTPATPTKPGASGAIVLLSPDEATRPPTQWSADICVPHNGQSCVNVTIDMSATNDEVTAALDAIRRQSGIKQRAVGRRGAPFWFRYGAVDAVTLHDHVAAGGTIAAWVRARAPSDQRNEEKTAGRMLAKLRRVARGELELVFRE